MSSHKTNFFKAGILALLAIFGLAACGGGPARNPGTGTYAARGTGTYAAHGVSFRYPAGWYEDIPGGPAPCCGAHPLWTARVGLDSTDMIYIAASRLPGRMTAQKLSALIPAITQEERDLYRHLGGRLLTGPQAITVNGMPGYRVQGTGRLHGTAAKTTQAEFFNGMTAYGVVCGYTPGKAQAVQRGCAQVLRTFKVSR